MKPSNWAFSDADVAQLRKMVEETAERKAKTAKAGSVHVKGTDYSPHQLAIEWGLGIDKIRELFANEPGVNKIQRPPKRGRRAYITLRIPENVAGTGSKAHVQCLKPMLEIYRRHNPQKCSSTDTVVCTNRRRPCPIWIRGTDAQGVYHRKPLRTRDWTVAEKRKNGMDSTGELPKPTTKYHD